MATNNYSETSQTRTNSTTTPPTQVKAARERGNFYFVMGFVLLIGLLVVIGLGALGITSAGVFELSTAMAMIAIAITLLAAVSFITLITLRRTIGLLSEHESALADQANRHADLAEKVQSQWRAEQVIRDRNQDAEVAALSAREDARFVDSQRMPTKSVRSSSRGSPSLANPFDGGQVHPVIDVEGIGPHYAKLLNENGIKDTEELWNADATYVAGALKIKPAAVENWQCMCELMAVTGIGKQYAELLVRADVSTIAELCEETALPLLGRINKLERTQSNRIQGNTISTKIVQNWIDAAQAHLGQASHTDGVDHERAVVGFGADADT